jgi:hypothetical protein
MKHGDKAKKRAKAKVPGKKASSKVAPKSKASQTVKSRKEVSPKAAAQKSGSARPATGNGKSATRGVIPAVGFSNPVVGAAFKRAVKKYPSAFRRLTD